SLHYLCHGCGHGYHRKVIVSTDTNQVVTVELKRGLTVEGIVLDAESDQPVEKAKVAPLIDRHPLLCPNRHRMVKTDSSGRFKVHAVHEYMGLWVEHERYGETEIEKVKEWPQVEDDPFTRRKTISLKQAPGITGKVVSTGGQPIESAEVTSYNGRRTTSDSDGKFVIYGAERNLEFSAPGFIEKKVSITNGMAWADVALQPEFLLTGFVRTPAGKPVTNFTAVTRDGKYCGPHNEKKKTFTNSQGKFQFKISEPVTNLVAIVADGFALKQVPAILKRPAEPLTVTLEKGLRVSGIIELPREVKEQVEVALIPQRCGSLWQDYTGGPAWVTDKLILNRLHVGGETVINLSSKIVTANTNGAYVFRNVSPGSYSLLVRGDDILPFERTVQITHGKQNLPGIKPALKETGVVKGRVFKPFGSCKGARCSRPEPWPFAEVDISAGDDQSFYAEFYKKTRADEEGFYSVTNVVAGPVSVSVNYPVTFDIGNTMFATGVVRPGETTVLDVFRKKRGELIEGKGELRIHVCVGDGSKEDFRRGQGLASGENVDEAKLSEWRPELIYLDQSSSCAARKAKIKPASSECMFVITNLPKGNAKLNLLDESDSWEKRIIWSTESPLNIPEKGRVKKNVILPPNSLTGRVTNEEVSMYTDLYLVCGGKEEHIPTGSPDKSRAFRFPFIPRGSYEFIAHQARIGWCKVNDIEISGLCDVGEIELKPGARVTARLMGNWTPVRSADQYVVSITHKGTGLTLSSSPNLGSNGGTAVFNNIWPGSWRLELKLRRSDKKTFFETDLEITAREHIDIDMEWSEIPELSNLKHK
ncbi:MAG: carboxypeptidase-like regulatory domain-containing protein, partial [Verrucomicrobiota bacterium]